MKSVNFYIFLLFSLLFSFPTFLSAQPSGKITGTLVDSATNEPVDFASVLLLNQSNNEYVTGSQSDVNGNFILNGVQSGTYLLKITFVGYRDYVQERIILTSGQSLNLGKIILAEEESNVLNEVVIEGQGPSMRLGIDRKIFDVEQSVISAGGSATDLLADIPSLSVEMDGTVSLRGSSGVQILIDGKPSALAGGDINQVLQSMPANSIASVEVITNPSSKYEADGQSGIINIVLKKNIRTGLNGMANLSAGSYGSYNGGINLNYRDRRVNYFGSYNHRKGVSKGDGFNLNRNLSNNSITENWSNSDRNSSSHRVRLGADYFLNESNTISLSGGFNIRDNNDKEKIDYIYSNQPVLDGTSLRKSFQDQEDFGFRINLDYKKEFARKGEELLASVSFGKSDEEGVQNFDQTFSNPQQFKDLRITDKKQDRKNYNIQLDYSLPFSEDKRFEAGYRSIIRNSEENQYSERFDPAQNLMVTDFGLSNGFDMKDEVHALYSNFQSSLTDNLGFQLGLRLEQAYLHTQYHSLNPADSEVPVKGKIDYLRLYPSFFLTQKFESDQQLQFSYTRRVRRPRGWQVNPFTDISDPMNIRVGNPNLLPEDIHSFELSYAKFWPKITFTSSVYHRRVNDLIESIRTSADNQTSATLSQWLNISSRQATGFEMISKVTFSRNLDVTGNVNVFHNSFKGSKEYDIKPVDGVNWDANLSGNLRLSKNFSMQSRARYNAPSYRAQGKSDGNFVMDTGLKLDVLDSKGSILFNVRDLFNQRKWSGYTETAQFYQDYENRWMSRSFMLTFNYRFGIQNVFNNKKGNGNSDDDFEDGNI